MGFFCTQTHACLCIAWSLSCPDFLSAVSLASAGSSSYFWALPQALAKPKRQVTALRGGETRRMIRVTLSHELEETEENERLRTGKPPSPKCWHLMLKSLKIS